MAAETDFHIAQDSSPTPSEVWRVTLSPKKNNEVWLTSARCQQEVGAPFPDLRFNQGWKMARWQQLFVLPVSQPSSVCKQTEIYLIIHSSLLCIPRFISWHRLYKVARLVVVHSILDASSRHYQSPIHPVDVLCFSPPRGECLGSGRNNRYLESPVLYTQHPHNLDKTRQFPTTQS